MTALDLAQPRPVPAKTNGVAKVPTVADPLGGLDALGKVALVGRSRIRTAAAAPITYAWQDIAVLGTIIVIAGDPGGGKTTLLFLVIAARLNLGTPVAVLNHAVTPSPAKMYFVLVEGEHSEGSTARKLVKSMRLLGIDDAALDRIIIVARKAVRIGSPEWDDVARLVAAGLVSDIACDTLARVAPADGDNEREQVAIFDDLARTIDAAPSESTKPTVWVVAHTRKNGQGGELVDVAGSAQRVGQADTVIMSRAERVDGKVVQARVVFAKLREEPETYPAPVDFAVTKDAIVYADATAKADDRPLEDRIIERLALGPRTKSKLADDVGRSRKDIEPAITNLFAARWITKTKVKVRGKEYPAFALSESGRTLGGRACPADVDGRDPDDSREGVNHAD